MTSWALATPLFASPDEPGQVIKAVAVAHGQLTGTTVRTGGYFDFETGVHVPAYYERALDETKCFIDNMGGTPSCAPAFDARDTHDKQVLTWIGRYPPLYYAIVGLPSLVSDGTAAVLAMRVVSAVLCGAFFAVGLTGLRAARQPSSMVAAGWLAITPTALFFGAVVNASGLEIAAGFATWGVLMPLLREPGRLHATGRLLAGAGTAAVLLNSRPGSGLLVLLVVGCLVLAASGGFWRSVRPWRRWVPMAAVAGVAVLAAGLWLLIVDPTASFGGTPHPRLAAPLTAAHAAASASGTTRGNSWRCSGSSTSPSTGRCSACWPRRSPSSWSPPWYWAAAGSGGHWPCSWCWPSRYRSSARSPPPRTWAWSGRAGTGCRCRSAFRSWRWRR